MHPEDTASSSRPGWDPLLVGSVLGLLSAVGYTGANIFLRQAAETVDPIWVSAVKAAPAALIAWIMIAYNALRGRPALPSKQIVLPLIATALVVQVVGNVGFQWGLGWLGLAITVPLTFGTLITGGALLGRLFLGEAIYPRTLVAMVVLIGAIAVLCLGAQQAEDANGAIEPLGLFVLLPIGVVCLAGFAFSLNGVAIRRLARGTTPVSAILVLINTTGVIVLGGWSLWQPGLSEIVATTPSQWWSMLGAGVFNAIAFFTLGYALQRIGVVHLNVLNASQVAMAACAGLLLFGEPLTLSLITGVSLTIVGLMLIQGRKRPAAATSQPIESDPELAPSLEESLPTEDPASTAEHSVAGPG